MSEPQKLPYKPIDQAYCRGIYFGGCVVFALDALAASAWLALAIAVLGAILAERAQIRFERQHTDYREHLRKKLKRG